MFGKNVKVTLLILLLLLCYFAVNYSEMLQSNANLIPIMAIAIYFAVNQIPKV